MKLAPAVRHLLLAAAAFVIFYAAASWRGAGKGDFRIDEAHKISESVYLRLLLDGDFSNPLWISHVVDRTNPPVGKYFLGFAILAAGEELPARSSLSLSSGPDAYVPPVHPPAQSAPYRPLLEAARRGSLVVSSLSAALLVFVTARCHSVTASVVAFVLYGTNFLTTLLAATAVFDPLLTFFVFGTVVSVAPLWSVEREARRRSARSSVVIGLVAAMAGALAFQTRLTGIIGFAVAFLLAIVALRRMPKRAALFAAISIPLFVLVSIAVNPYYWAKVEPSAAAPAALTADESLLPRIASRVSHQLDDLDWLLEKTRTRTPVLESTAARLRFFSETVGGDLPGLVLLLLSSLALFTPLLTRNVEPETRNAKRPGLYFFLVAGVLVTGAFVVWLPLAWPRYLLVVVPPLAAMSGVAVSEITAWALKEWSR